MGQESITKNNVPIRYNTRKPYLNNIGSLFEERTSELKLVKSHHVGLTVLSLEKSLKFYRDIIGLEEVFSWNPKADYIKRVTGYMDADFHISVLRVPNSESFLELLEYRGSEKVEIDHRTGNPGIAHIAFQVEDVDSFFHFLKSKGVQSVSEPVTPSAGPNEGGRVVYMIDPDGFRVELIQTKKSFGDFSPKKV